MVAALLSLRFRVLANTLNRNVLQLLAVIFGGLQTVVILGIAIAGLAVLVIYPHPIQQATVVIGGVAVTLGWFLIPLVATGIEPTIDPLKLSPFPLSVTKLMAAMTLVGATWIPGIATLIVSISTALTWRETPGAAGAAVGCGVVATLICIVGSRMTASLSTNLVAGRRGRDRVVVLLVGALVLLGPVALAVTLGLGSDAPFPATADVLAVTPFGAIWSVPGQLAVGHPAAAVGSLAIALATLVLLLVVWRASLLATFRYRGGGAGRTQVSAGRLGLFAVAPATPVGAIGARSLIYWMRDARFARQLVLVPVMPALLILLGSLVHVSWTAYLAPPIVAGLLPLTLFAVISYDGTAFALHLSTGVRGIGDRIGRAVAMLAFALPALVIVSAVSLGVVGAWADLPAIFGISLGVLLSGLATVSVSSASIVVPVARSGRSPFTAQAGSGMTSLAASYAVTGVTIALAVPELALGIAALIVHSALLGWVALAVGLLWGAGSLVICVRVGGRILDRTGPALLARMRRTGG
ncbi:MAG TPA: transporter [Pseudolysinimonas sp.]|nr:transporter [Pseudolysinimonas sp.]